MENLQPVLNKLSDESLVLQARVQTELGPLPDPTTLPSAEGRALSQMMNIRCNLDLPLMQNVTDVWVDADAELGSARCRLKVLVPPEAQAGAILFVHGGGFAFCSPETHERCARVLAIESGLPVVLPDYRLAPENPYPAGLLDVIAAWRNIFKVTASAEVSQGPLIIAGDSAGANLALASMLHEQTTGRPMPAGALLFYGNYAHSFDTPSYMEFADGPGLTREKMQRYWAFYAGQKCIVDDPLACPLMADDEALAALPPLYLLAAVVDPLLSDTQLLFERLIAVGRKDDLDIVPGVMHGFLQNSRELVAARNALATAGQAARQFSIGLR
ncbi:alpha/beta hydrolase [Brucella gallinifaecis]|uniref:Alpha/beta hydrolase n=1 Tax=Brucella gallinifaecis TaxID=215590 RepID=A0A502BUF2_9HYPH|nr:alpha/beta hydrolase [Brucella gallinifaecis]TPF76816.1 alpha/beta hydrolase [Brucella gallinifaecis]